MADLPPRSAPLRDHLVYLAGCYREQASATDVMVITPVQAGGMAEYLEWLAARAAQDAMPLPANVVPFGQRAATPVRPDPGPEAA